VVPKTEVMHNAKIDREQNSSAGDLGHVLGVMLAVRQASLATIGAFGVLKKVSRFGTIHVVALTVAPFRRVQEAVISTVLGCIRCSVFIVRGKIRDPALTDLNRGEVMGFVEPFLTLYAGPGAVMRMPSSVFSTTSVLCRFSVLNVNPSLKKSLDRLVLE